MNNPTGEFPQISNSNYGGINVNPNQGFSNCYIGGVYSAGALPYQDAVGTGTALIWDPHIAAERFRRFRPPNPLDTRELMLPPPADQKKEVKMVDQKNAKEKARKVSLRVVQIFIADPDTKLPPSRRLLYMSSVPFATEATDEELFFELDIKTLLETHNSVRTATRDPAIKSKEVFLEPVRIRDLDMHIITLVTFFERDKGDSAGQE